MIFQNKQQSQTERPDLAEDARERRGALLRKPSLKRIYERTYEKMLRAAADVSPGAATRVEIGSGGGFLDEMDPAVITSDTIAIPLTDIAFDAQHMPFRDASVDVVFAMHVLHHIPSIHTFLSELTRVLRPGGALVAVEPYWSPFAHLMFKYFHPESFETGATGWETNNQSLSDANQALSYMMLQRDRAYLSERYPQFEVSTLESFSGPSYVLSGGVWKPPMLPDKWIAWLWDYEDSHRWWRRAFALHHLFVLRLAPGYHREGTPSPAASFA